MNNEKAKTILLVEDDIFTAMTTKMLIQKFGYNVLTANTGEDAVKIATQCSNINLILMDIDLGSGIDGTEAAKQILAFCHIPIVFLTSHTEEEYVKKVKEITRYGYVVKNSGAFVLKSSIEMAFELFNHYQKTKESEEKYRLLFETMAPGVVYQSAEGEIISANPSAEKMLGLTLEQMKGKTSMDPRWKMITEDGVEVPGSEHPAMIALKTGEKVGPVIRGVFVPEKNEYVWLSVTAIPLFRQGESKPYQVYATFDDVTERKKARDKAKALQKLLQDTGKMAKVGGWELDAETLEVSWTEQTYHIHEVPLDYKPPLDEAINFFHPEDRPILIKAIDKALKYGEPFDLELRFITAKGKHLWTHAIGNPQIIDGKVIKLTGTFQDITNRKKAEEQITFQAKLLNAVGQSVIATDKHGKIIFLNPAAEQLYGWKYCEIIGKDINQVITSPEMLEQGEEILKTLLEGKDWKGEFLVKNKEGQTFWVEVTDSPILDENGNLIGIIGVSTDINQRKKFEQALKTNQERYQKAQQIGKTGNWEYNVQTTCFWFSEGAKRIYGFDLNTESFTTEEVESCIPERERVHQALVDLIEQDKTYNLEFDIITKDTKERKTIICIAELERDSAGNPLKISGVIQDITERKKVEKELKESEAKYRFLTENIADVVWILDLETQRFTYVSPSVIKLRGYTPEEIMNQPMEEALTPESLAYLKQITGQRVEEFYSNPDNPVVHYTELQQPCKDGSIIWTEAVTYYRINQDTKHLEVIGTSRNINDRKRAEEELKRSKALFKSLTDKSFDIMSILAADGTILYESNATKHILGYDAGERDGQNAFKFVHPDDRERVISKFENLVSETGGTAFAEFRYQHKDGHWVWFEAIGQNFLHDPNINGIIINSRDITDRKKAEEALKKSEKELRQLNETKDKFFSIIAHDLKNPFGAFLSGTEILKEYLQNSDDDNAKVLSAELHKMAKRVYELLENLLEWSQLQQGLIPYHPTKADLCYLANNVVNLLSTNAKSKNIDLQCLIKEGTVVYADYNMLKNILNNLIFNSIKFTNYGGKIIVDAQDSGDFVEVSVMDNGVGMSSEKIERLFKIGEQKISTTGTAGERGTGLGLILCKEFVEKNGGKIWVESEIGKGSAFKFTLPKGLEMGS
ncbi:MAG: PAS domain S-box protein [Thermodesulfovibrionales bacterium]|nr:PAS domain S-box protein [Thermodesulfovibrionales bacterium]